MGFNAVKMLSIFLLLFLNSGWGLAVNNKPIFKFPNEITNNLDKLYIAQPLLVQAFKDAITLARIAVLTGAECDDEVRLHKNTLAP